MTLFLALLPSLISVIGWILGKVNANEATKKAFLDLVQAAKLDPAISLKMKKDFKSMEDELRSGGGK